METLPRDLLYSLAAYAPVAVAKVARASRTLWRTYEEDARAWEPALLHRIKTGGIRVLRLIKAMAERIGAKVPSIMYEGERRIIFSGDGTKNLADKDDGTLSSFARSYGSESSKTVCSYRGTRAAVAHARTLSIYRGTKLADYANMAATELFFITEEYLIIQTADSRVWWWSTFKEPAPRFLHENSRHITYLKENHWAMINGEGLVGIMRGENVIDIVQCPDKRLFRIFAHRYLAGTLNGLETKLLDFCWDDSSANDMNVSTEGWVAMLYLGEILVFNANLDLIMRFQSYTMFVEHWAWRPHTREFYCGVHEGQREKGVVIKFTF